jgi:uncharacterized LabA/DUF88 family protein
MERFAVFVDAGYFFAAGSQAIRGSSAARRNISIRNVPALIAALKEQASKQCENLSLLRIYWYDAILGPRMSLEQAMLAHQVGLKLRLGSLNNAGEQKGVDSLIVTDLIELARNGAIADAVIVSGDEDLRVAVQVAQTFGVRVHVLAVGDASRNVSSSLQMEADSVSALDKTWLDVHIGVQNEVVPGLPTAVRLTPPLLVPENDQPRTLEKAAEEMADVILSALQHQEVEALRDHFAAGNQTVPPEFDRKLIAMTARSLSRRLEPAELRRIRGVFVGQVRKRGAEK